jgi:hypothetical protein
VWVKVRKILDNLFLISMMASLFAAILGAIIVLVGAFAHSSEIKSFGASMSGIGAVGFFAAFWFFGNLVTAFRRKAPKVNGLESTK